MRSWRLGGLVKKTIIYLHTQFSFSKNNLVILIKIQKLACIQWHHRSTNYDPHGQSVGPWWNRSYSPSSRKIYSKCCILRPCKAKENSSCCLYIFIWLMNKYYSYFPRMLFIKLLEQRVTYKMKQEKSPYNYLILKYISIRSWIGRKWNS